MILTVFRSRKGRLPLYAPRTYICNMLQHNDLENSHFLTSPVPSKSKCSNFSQLFINMTKISSNFETQLS